jgi:hypothetical protein
VNNKKVTVQQYRTITADVRLGCRPPS